MKKKCFEHQTLGPRFVCPIVQSNPTYHIVNWRISNKKCLSRMKDFGQNFAISADVLGSQGAEKNRKKGSEDPHIVGRVLTHLKVSR